MIGDNAHLSLGNHKDNDQLEAPSVQQYYGEIYREVCGWVMKGVEGGGEGGRG